MTAAIPFAGQRLVCFVLLLGMTAYAIAAAVMLQMNEGVGLADEPNDLLDTIALATGAAIGVVAVALRVFMRSRAETLTGAARSMARFKSILFPLAMLEAGSVFAITVWLLNGAAVPALATALVLLAVAIAIVPFSDPDAG